MNILVLPGDGIGPEITQATLAVLERASDQYGLGLTWERLDIGFATLKAQGSTMPQAVMDACRATPAIILGPVDHLQYPAPEQGGVNPSGWLRVQLDLYANIRPAKSRLGVGLTGKPVDLVIFRECTEGFYADRNMYLGIGEFMPTEDVALAVRKVTARQCSRIARAAFEAARKRRHKKVSAIHKANVMRMSDALFLREVRKVAAEFPDVQLEELIVDATAALLLRDPTRFDVMVTGNMFGDILSDEASELSGSLGLAGSVMQGDTQCVAQAQHGSAPDIAGQDRANPTSLILSAAMMLDWIGTRESRPEFEQAAQAIESAVDACLHDKATRTRDLGGALGTRAFAAAVAARIGP